LDFPLSIKLTVLNRKHTRSAGASDPFAAGAVVHAQDFGSVRAPAAPPPPPPPPPLPSCVFCSPRAVRRIAAGAAATCCAPCKRLSRTAAPYRWSNRARCSRSNFTCASSKIGQSPLHSQFAVVCLRCCRLNPPSRSHMNLLSYTEWWAALGRQSQ
jgi:hypothetical protein